MKRIAVTWLCVALALAACGKREAETRSGAPQAAAPAAAHSNAEAKAAQAPAAPAPQAAAAAPAPGAPERWLLSEFSWGDSEDTVYETVEYTNGFLCLKHKLREHCAFVKTKVDGEELLARFHFFEKKLWRIDVLTPDLDASQSDQHLERVWKILAGYITRFYGEAPEQTPFPQRDSIAPGKVHVTHRWKLADQEIRLLVGRAKGDDAKWYTAAHFVEPKWAAHEPPVEPETPQPRTASPTS